jgi:LmbE family N-acetylglucosaminyl deacetylase
MRYIYLSAHLDDAVLSAGGLIWEQAQAADSVEIWTFMTGVPSSTDLSEDAGKMHKIWGTTTAAATISLRRAEDRRAASIVGATTRHLGFVDALYRRGAGGEALYSDVLRAPVHPADAGLTDRLADDMRSRLRPGDVLVCQLGIGEHVDHVLLRAAAERLGHPLLYLADVPYALGHPDELARFTSGLVAAVTSVTPPGLDAWIAGIHAYGSQLSSLFASPEATDLAIRGYWAGFHGIRLWSQQPPVVPPQVVLAPSPKT